MLHVKKQHAQAFLHAKTLHHIYIVRSHMNYCIYIRTTSPSYHVAEPTTTTRIQIIAQARPHTYYYQICIISAILYIGNAGRGGYMMF